jgi:hypothetical protein
MKTIEFALFFVLTFCSGIYFIPQRAEEVGKAKSLELVFASQVTNGFQMSLCFSNDIHLLGQPMLVNVNIKNVSTNTLPIRVTDGLTDYKIEIIHSNGEPVKVTSMGERYLYSTSIYHRSLAFVEPKQTMSFYFDLNVVFDFTRTGKYSVLVSRRIYDQGLLIVGPFNFVLTNSVK